MLLFKRTSSFKKTQNRGNKMESGKLYYIVGSKKKPTPEDLKVEGGWVILTNLISSPSFMDTCQILDRKLRESNKFLLIIPSSQERDPEKEEMIIEGFESEEQEYGGTFIIHDHTPSSTVAFEVLRQMEEAELDEGPETLFT